jgi:hypothetical protein
VFAADLGTGQTQVFAQKIDKRGARLHRARLDNTVDLDLDRDEER